MIDLSRLPLPKALEVIDPETLISAFMTRFVAVWAEARLIDPSLPQYNVEQHELDPVRFMSQVWANLRLLDRQRVNDAVKALLAPFSAGADLDNVVARQGLARLVVMPAIDAKVADQRGELYRTKEDRWFDTRYLEKS